MVCTFCKKCPKCAKCFKQKPSHNVRTCLALRAVVAAVVLAKAAKITWESFKEQLVIAAGTAGTALVMDACGASGAASMSAAGGAMYELYNQIVGALDVAKFVKMKKSEQAKYVIKYGLFKEFGKDGADSLATESGIGDAANEFATGLAQAAG